MQDIQIIKKIDAYVKGKLSPEEIEDLWVEFLKNPEYLTYLDTATNLKALIESESESNVTNIDDSGNGKSSFFKSYGRWITLAASLLITVGIIIIFSLKKNQSQIDSIAYINKTEFESSNVLRSTNEQLPEINQLLNKGYQESINGQDSKALTTYKHLIEKYNTGLEVSKAYLNIGIIHYNNDNFHEAISSFNNAILANENNSIIKEKAFWYKGNAFIQLKEYQKAKQAIRKVYSMNGIYRKPAYNLLKHLNQKD